MNYENDIYRQPVWNQEEAANFFNNQNIMAAQVPDQTPINDDGWADIMKSGASSLGGGKVSDGINREPLAGSKGATLSDNNYVKQGGFGRYKAAFMGKFGG